MTDYSHKVRTRKSTLRRLRAAARRPQRFGVKDSDWLIFFAMLGSANMLGRREDVRGLVISIFTRRRVSAYFFSYIGENEITSPLGVFSTRF